MNLILKMPIKHRFIWVVINRINVHKYLAPTFHSFSGKKAQKRYRTGSVQYKHQN